MSAFCIDISSSGRPAGRGEEEEAEVDNKYIRAANKAMLFLSRWYADACREISLPPFPRACGTNSSMFAHYLITPRAHAAPHYYFLFTAWHRGVSPRKKELRNSKYPHGLSLFLSLPFSLSLSLFFSLFAQLPFRFARFHFFLFFLSFFSSYSLLPAGLAKIKRTSRVSVNINIAQIRWRIYVRVYLCIGNAAAWLDEASHSKANFWTREN